MRLEVACDESGSEGENLVGGNTDVLAHASVRVSPSEAEQCLDEIQARIRSRANNIYRPKHRAVLEWFLGPDGPVHGRVHVHVIDNAYFLVGRLIEVLIAEQETGLNVSPFDDPDVEAEARTLCREGPLAFGRELWNAFLIDAAGLMRARDQWADEAFFHTVDRLRADLEARSSVAPILDRLRGARPRADDFRFRLRNTTPAPPLDPLYPAIVRTIAYWTERHTTIEILHDRQNLLTDHRIALLHKAFEEGLAGFRLIDAGTDARVLLADIFAGTIRAIVSDDLAGRGDPILTSLVEPYVSEESCRAEPPVAISRTRADRSSAVRRRPPSVRCGSPARP